MVLIDLIGKKAVERMVDHKVKHMEKRINDMDLQLHALREEKKVKRYFK